VSKIKVVLNKDSQAEVLTMTTETKIKEKTQTEVSKAQAEHKISDKFGSRLDALFQEPPTPIEREQKVTTKTNSRVKKVRPRLGLDALIRNTRSLSAENSAQNDEQKRVTFIYSRNQLEKIRQISKYESRYMKDIIGEAVNQWIDKYERKLLKKANPSQT